MHTRPRRRAQVANRSVFLPGYAGEPVTAWLPPDPVPPTYSPRVRLEVDILAADHVVSMPVPVLARAEVRVRPTVLLLSRQSEVRRHLRACLDQHPRLRLVEVNSVRAAASLASEVAVHLIIADPGTAAVTRALPEVRTIQLVDQLPAADSPAPGPQQHVMQRPFSAETLEATVVLLLQESLRG